MTGMLCTTCGTVRKPKTSTPGSFVIEVILWLCFLIPGLIYSIWRISSRKKLCAVCGSGALVPPDSPVARKFRHDVSPAYVDFDVRR